ncbi:MAG: hypothetical protein K6G18_15165 [Treponema sp.]|nr:hypothetical protein [Treponema sp.]
MSYEAVAEQVRSLPEDCLEDVSRYISFLMSRRGLDKMNSLVESEEEFNANMQKGYDDIVQGRVQLLREAFADIKRRFTK